MAVETSSYSIRGGARIGLLRVSWPFARLSCSAERLEISMLGGSPYTFSSEEVAAFEVSPWSLGTVRIRHNVIEYPERIRFWSWGQPRRIIAAINRVGFHPNPELQVFDRGSPYRLSARIVSTAAWVALYPLLLLALFQFGSSIGKPWRAPFFPGWMFCAIYFAWLLLLIGVRKSPKVQRLILKDGRPLVEIQQQLRFITALVAAFFVFLCVLAVFFSLRWPAVAMDLPHSQLVSV